ncbi:MAG: MBOAT family protein [Muribaculaceae bacterium]|nr:MBOAT family protein [Muribaculaceae bacterium]
MLFNSLEFLLFLPVVFAVYWLLCNRLHWQNVLVVAASYVFYGWWDWRCLGLIALTSACSYGSAAAMSQCRSGRVRCTVCAANVTLNLGILGAFKYFNFFAAELSQLLGMIGVAPDWGTLTVVLPVGISFYTFQALSYTIDVYRREVPPTRDAVAFFAYISFFPQLVAGPIERASDLLPQFLRKRQFHYAQAVDGVRQMLWGFFKKMVVADNCAAVVNQVWDNHHHTGGAMLVVAAVMFAFQIYGDFSGYSDIAIGCARMFGIRLTRNFHHPYFAASVQDFWRRWHISLMRWFTHYVYFPLGGSRRSRWITVRNILIVFALSGLWHGANWTFVVWGLYHGVLLAVWRMGKVRLPQVLGMVLTFGFVTLGWVLFRAPSIGEAASYLTNMVANPWGGISASAFLPMAAIAVLLIAEWLTRDREHPLQFASASWPAHHASVRWGCYAMLATAISLLAGTQSQFIYFQF